MKRRTLLKSGGIALFAAGGVLPPFIMRSARAAEGPAGFERQKVVVTIFQRFGMDGLMAATPYDDEQRLAKLRPSLMLGRPGSGEPMERIDLDGRFGLHPGFAPLLPMFRDGDLAIVHAAGSPHNTRSHGEAQLWWESGTPGNHRTTDGWLNRTLGATAVREGLPLRAIAATQERPRIFYGDHAAATLADADSLSLSVADSAAADSVADTLRSLYSQAGNELVRASGLSGLETARILSEARSARERNGGSYPEGSAFAQSLSEIAWLIKANVGLQLAFAESVRAGPNNKGIWDTHSNQAAPDGPFQLMADDFSRSLVAFFDDLGSLRDDVVVVTLTDFGRNVVENDGIGTDHGRATAMFVMGGAVDGGRVYGELPERFERDALEDLMDLPVTTDFRSVIAPLIARQLGVRDDGAVFPGWNGGRMEIAAA